MYYDKSAVLLGRGVMTGACRLQGNVEFYFAEDGTVYAYHYTVGDKAATGKGVIAGYCEALTRRKTLRAYWDRGEVRIVDE